MTSFDQKGLASRHAAYDVLQTVLIQKQPLDQTLERSKFLAALNDQDRGFARMMIMTILRHKGQLDYLIARAAHQDKPLHPETIRLVLYIGIVQILLMDVPDHAAVNVTVDLAKHTSHEKQSGLINAILRRMMSEGREWFKGIDSVQANIPAWLLSNWIDTYGLKIAANIGEASLTQASLDITVKDKSMSHSWAGALDATILPTGSLRRASGGNITHLQGFDEGAWWIQDASAALPVQLMGDVAGKNILDLCAAPGGKTAQLAANSAHVTAVDRSAKRLLKLKENLARLKLEKHVQTEVSDGANWQVKTPYDGVIIDAPCTATGTIRRHPDVMHLKSIKDMNALMATQKRLLDNAAGLVKSGGLLVYCTCSLQAEESEDQVAAFLSENPNFDCLPIMPEEVGGIDAMINQNGELRVLPFHLPMHGGMDGFFAARLQKK